MPSTPSPWVTTLRRSHDQVVRRTVDLDATGLTKGQKFFLYTPNLDHLSNDAENFGGLMTEVNICSSVDPQTKACTI